jgi:hypothetical protein
MEVHPAFYILKKTIVIMINFYCLNILFISVLNILVWAFQGKICDGWFQNINGTIYKKFVNTINSEKNWKMCIWVITDYHVNAKQEYRIILKVLIHHNKSRLVNICY